MGDKNNAFILKGTDQSFLQRQKNVFDQLQAPSQNHPVEQMETDRPRKRHKSPTPKLSRLRGKESIFKRPHDPVFNKHPLRNMPDFKKNPHKWTKYSLADVKEEEMSDKSNTSAALSFLNELRRKRNREESGNMETDDKDEEDTHKVVFRKKSSQGKTTMVKEDNKSVEEKVSFRSSKVVMPEYVVGRKKNAQKGSKVKNKDDGQLEKDAKKSSALKLEHLFEEEEDE